MENLQVIEKPAKGYTLLKVSGVVNSYTHTEFQKPVYEAIKEGNLCLDMEAVYRLSSAGLGVLMTSLDIARESGHDLYIYNPSRVVKKALDSTGFTDLFAVIYSLDEISE